MSERGRLVRLPFKRSEKRRMRRDFLKPEWKPSVFRSRFARTGGRAVRAPTIKFGIDER
ncbi:MAG: hypothetical protein ACR2HG_08955 [Pyrinomonadaceae bacterium]